LASADPPAGWNNPCDADLQTSKEVKAMIPTTLFFAILFSVALALGIVLLKVTHAEPVKVLDRERIH
jgi:hypothetical protein